MVVLTGGPTLPILQRWQLRLRELSRHDQAIDDNMYEPISYCQAPNPDSPAWEPEPCFGKAPTRVGPQLLRLPGSGHGGYSGIHGGSGLPPERLTLLPPSPASASETWSKPQGGDGVTGATVLVPAEPRIPLMPFLLSCCFLASPKNAAVAVPLRSSLGSVSFTATQSHQQVWAGSGVQEILGPDVLLAWSTSLLVGKTT